MKTNKFAGVHLYQALVNGSWHICYTIHYFGKTLNTGSVYLGDAFNHGTVQRTRNSAFNRAEDWAKQNGFDGVLVR